MNQSKIIKEVVFHLLLGLLALRVPIVANVWMIGYFGYGLMKVASSKNRSGLAHMLAMYFMAYEAFYRMTGTSGLPYEFAKYAVLILLIVGMVNERKVKRGRPIGAMWYLLLLLPATLLTDFGSLDDNRKQVLFYLSGPICLTVSCWYFYGRKFSGQELKQLLYRGILGFIPMLIYVYGYVDLETIEFNTDANFAATGGFGSNQVSTAIGVCMFFLILLNLRKEVLFFYKYVDWMLLLYVIFRGFLTFSRGGMLVPSLALLVGMMFFAQKHGFLKLKITRMIPKLIFISVLFSSMFYFANKLSDDKLVGRYLGLNSAGEQKEDITTGRKDMILADWEVFQENPVFGVGVGMSKMARTNFGEIARASHTEMSRMLSEHGMFGIIALLILIFMPLRLLLFNMKHERSSFILVTCVIIGIGTMGHSAMRMALPAFLYGFAFIQLIKNDPPPREQTT